MGYPEPSFSGISRALSSEKMPEENLFSAPGWQVLRRSAALEDVVYDEAHYRRGIYARCRENFLISCRGINPETEKEKIEFSLTEKI